MATYKDTVMNIKTASAQRDLIDMAAKMTNKTRTDFVLEAASEQAQNVLLDRRLFHTDAESFTLLEQLLDAPAQDNPALEKLLKRKGPWEK